MYSPITFVTSLLMFSTAVASAQPTLTPCPIRDRCLAICQANPKFEPECTVTCMTLPCGFIEPEQLAEEAGARSRRESDARYWCRVGCNTGCIPAMIGGPSLFQKCVDKCVATCPAS